MRKSDKKIDNQLIKLLTEVCDLSLKSIAGFQWLTHTANYDNFPKSLQITCVFDTNESLITYQEEDNNALLSFIQSKLSSAGIKLKNISAHIRYDSEENCLNQHNGNWARRLAQH